MIAITLMVRSLYFRFQAGPEALVAILILARLAQHFL